MKKVLAIDMGATSIRGIVGYINEGKLQVKEVMRFSHEIKKINGRLRWEFDTILNKITQTISENVDEIFSIGIDAWGVDFGLIGKDEKLMEMPICYRDSRHEIGLNEAIIVLDKKEIFKETGTQIMNINTLFQLLAFRKINHETYANAEKLLMIPDLIQYLLTGEIVGEETILSTTQMLNLKTGGYSNKILKAFGIDENKLPPITRAGTVTGNVKDGFIEELKNMNVNVVSVCGHDTAGAVLMTKAMIEDDTMFLSCGTWSLFGIKGETPNLSQEFYERGFSNEFGYNSTPLLFKNLTGLYLFEKYKTEYETKINRRLGFEEITHYVEKSIRIKAIIDNLIDIEDSRFANEGISAKETIDTFFKEKNKRLPEEDMDYFRIIYESLVEKYKEVKESLEKISGKRYKKIHIIGGGAKSSVLCKLIKDKLGVTVIAGPYEASALGNIIVQLKALGEIDSIEEGIIAVYKSQEIKQY